MYTVPFQEYELHAVSETKLVMLLLIVKVRVTVLSQPEIEL